MHLVPQNHRHIPLEIKPSSLGTDFISAEMDFSLCPAHTTTELLFEFFILNPPGIVALTTASNTKLSAGNACLVLDSMVGDLWCDDELKHPQKSQDSRYAIILNTYEALLLARVRQPDSP